MQRLEKKVEEMPEDSKNSLEDSIKTMMRPWKNDNNQKWNDIIRQAETYYLQALKILLERKAGWIKKGNYQKSCRGYATRKTSLKKGIHLHHLDNCQRSQAQLKPYRKRYITSNNYGFLLMSPDPKLR